MINLVGNLECHIQLEEVLDPEGGRDVSGHTRYFAHSASDVCVTCNIIILVPLDLAALRRLVYVTFVIIVRKCNFSTAVRHRVLNLELLFCVFA